MQQRCYQVDYMGYSIFKTFILENFRVKIKGILRKEKKMPLKYETEIKLAVTFIV